MIVPFAERICQVPWQMLVSTLRYPPAAEGELRSYPNAWQTPLGSTWCQMLWGGTQQQATSIRFTRLALCEY